MGKIVIVAYRPLPGKAKELEKVIESHIPVLKMEGLVTDREPIVMKSANGCLIEIFEWKSAIAMEKAHKNKAVLELWDRFRKVCEYEKLANIKEFSQLFSEFEPVN